MKSLFMLAAFLVISLTSVAQTELRIKTEFSLRGTLMQLFNDDGQRESMTDMIVWSDNEISLWVEPGEIYTFKVNEASFMVFPVADQPVVYSYIPSSQFFSGWMDLYSGTEPPFKPAMKSFY